MSDIEYSVIMNDVIKSFDCTRNCTKVLKSPLILPFTGGFNSVFGDLNQYKIVVPLFGAAYAAPNKGTTILY